MAHPFLQIHFLSSYPAALLNRDDAGFAKRLPFGGAVRTRISSQCLKRHWRTFDGEHGLARMEEPMSVRSRITFDRYLYRPLLEAGVDEKLATTATHDIMDLVFQKSEKAKKKEAEGETDAKFETSQVTVLGRPEMDYFLSLAKEACGEAEDESALKKILQTALDKGEGKKNLMALTRAAGLDAALFGRMVTSDILSRGDAAVHVAHAFTVHREHSESDYFSAVDDLTAESGETGSGHINSTELTSGLYYGYVAVDVPLLVSNLEGCARDKWQEADRALAGRVLENLVHLVAKVSPGAKLGSTAPYSYASFLMAEMGSEQPRTLANAFLSPVKERPDLLGNTYAALAGHIAGFKKMYGWESDVQLAGQNVVPELLDQLGKGESELKSVSELASWINQTVAG